MLPAVSYLYSPNSDNEAIGILIFSATHRERRDQWGVRHWNCRTFPLGFALERHQLLVWAFDFLFGLEKFFTPRLASALGALVNCVAHGETVIARPLRARARELLAFLAGLKELALERSVLIPQFVFTDDAHLSS